MLEAIALSPLKRIIEMKVGVRVRDCSGKPTAVSYLFFFYRDAKSGEDLERKARPARIMDGFEIYYGERP